ncbi:isoprenyl transferase [Streptomyces phytophilus]|uniref:isoprenyl transferase n=1 Tax=Streptomyces phytophilus TaxID=722715 RepID=UPI0015EFF930|nr:isoprenyl transferase [Streptomyces phytophilus]
MTWRGIVYRVYEKRLERRLDPARVPKHIGVILDGNRRWARAAGGTTEQGHQAGAEKIHELIRWCRETDVEVLTLWLLSTDNLDRPEPELNPLLAIIEEAVSGVAVRGGARVHHVGNLDLLPMQTQRILKEAEEATLDVGTGAGSGAVLVNVAVAYGGRQEIADAVRSMLGDAADQGRTLADVAETVEVEHIAQHLYTRGQPDPDLVIRTSGEQRLSGFMLWQSAHSEYYFCEVFWPAFRRVDFLRALRDYAARHRRFGG